MTHGEHIEFGVLENLWGPEAQLRPGRGGSGGGAEEGVELGSGQSQGTSSFLLAPLEQVQKDPAPALLCSCPSGSQGLLLPGLCPQPVG